MRKAFKGLKNIFLVLLIISSSLSYADVPSEEVTINYQNVALVEYIKFVSKITGYNFVYNPDDLNFTVTILSNDPTTKQNVMSTLIQILRINNLYLIENGNNLIISKNQNAKEIGTVVVEDDQSDDPIITRIFSLQNIKVETITSILRPMLSNDALIEASMETKQLIVTDTKTSIDKVSTLIEALDTGSLPIDYAVYQVVDTPIDQLIQSTEQIIRPLTMGNQFYLIPHKSTGIIYIVSTPGLTKKALSLLKEIDTAPKKEMPVTEKGQAYFLYKLKNVSGEIIEEDFDALSEKLKSSDVVDQKLLNVIENAKWIKETNSILLTGDQQSVDEAKALIDHYDILREDIKIKGKFLMFSPKYVSLSDIEKSLNDIANNLQKSGLVDKNLIESIKTLKVVKSTNSLVFTGSHETLEKINGLLISIDNPQAAQAIQKVGKTNFYVYKIQNSKPQSLMISLRSLADDLAKMDSSNVDFITTLKSMKYVKDTNSLVFTGSQESLEKLQSLIEKFDIPITKDDMSTYFIYKPKYLSSEELESVLNNFAEQIKVTGLDNEALFEVINSMKYSDKTSSFVFTGESLAIEELKGLLDTFDVPIKGGASTEISGLDDLGFLVYKLQYHKGNEIQEALQQISKELKIQDNSQASKLSLVKTIDSIQWVQLTNSLLLSGDPQTLAKMKELIGSLDVPLKQVFIEVLIIETTLVNALSFGLDWGSKMQWKNKAAGGIGNFQDGTNPFQNTVNAISNTNTPTGANIPLSSGFDLGIIGDLLFHKGKSFLSLASLLQALQTDAETSVVMTPKIIAQDGKTSKIFSGNNIPYSGSVITNNSQAGSSLVTTNLEYRDIGVSLTITPILGNSDNITLTIDLESSQRESPGTTTDNLGQVVGITTSKTIMNTSVHIPNKHFLVLSGMVKDTKSRSKQGIPCLGGLPYIGAAFAKDVKNSAKDNVVIFIRPHIINSFMDMENITNIQEDYFRDKTGTPTLERDYEEATEEMKIYDEE